jgi:hypothetical protein
MLELLIMSVSVFRNGALALLLALSAFLSAVPQSSKAATIFNSVDLDVPVVDATIYTMRWWRYAPPRGALNIDLFGTGRTDLSIWMGRVNYGSYAQLTLYAKAGGGRALTDETRRRVDLSEGYAYEGYGMRDTLTRLFSARVSPERCFSGTCRPERTIIDHAFGGFLGVTSGSTRNWRFPRQHGWLQIDMAEDLSFSVSATGYETETGVASVIGAGRPPAVVAPAPIPLPASGWALMAALGGLIALRRRKA